MKTVAVTICILILFIFSTGCSESVHRQDAFETDDISCFAPIENNIATQAETQAETKPEKTQPNSGSIDIIPEEDKMLSGYTALEGWYEPQYVTGKVTGGGYKLLDEVMGLKVYYVQKRLNIRPNTWGYYRDPLPGEVAYFQGMCGLEATGSVDLDTWLAMGFSEDDWHNLGTYVSPVMIEPSFSREEIIDVFTSRAMEYLGTPFVVGASGKPGQGVDCSGLVLQCMYSIGIYPNGIDPVQHSTVEEYNSRLMWADPKFKEVAINDLIPGDLVFYRRPWSRSVCHVAIYLGENQCIEALYGEVEILPLYKDGEGYTIMGCKRVIALQNQTP